MHKCDQVCANARRLSNISLGAQDVYIRFGLWWWWFDVYRRRRSITGRELRGIDSGDSPSRLQKRRWREKTGREKEKGRGDVDKEAGMDTDKGQI